MTIKLICLDADDTLWHNMRHFNATEEALVAMLQPFADADIARDTLNACEGRNLKLYGYGAKGFTLSMIETAAELAGDQISKSMIEDILAAGRALLAHPVDLFDDVADTLDALAHRGRLVLVTKGDLFSGIEIVSDKTENTFRRVFGQYGAAPHEAIMAGDSLRSDIRPALEAGAWAAYIPQEGAWVHEIADTPADHPRFRQIDRLAELPALIDTIG